VTNRVKAPLGAVSAAPVAFGKDTAPPVDTVADVTEIGQRRRGIRRKAGV
jgi:hypothetical protein